LINLLSLVEGMKGGDRQNLKRRAKMRGRIRPTPPPRPINMRNKYMKEQDKKYKPPLSSGVKFGLARQVRGL